MKDVGWCPERQQQLAHGGDIQAAVEHIFDRPIVQVEAINVDVCFHVLITRKPPNGGFVPFRRSYLGGYVLIILEKARIVNIAVLQISKS